MTIYHRGTIKGFCSLQIQALLQTKMQKVIQRATQRRRRRNKKLSYLREVWYVVCRSSAVQTEIQECNTRATERRRRRRRNKRTLLLEKCGVPPRVLELEDSTLMLVETQLHPERLLIAQYVKYTAKNIIFFTNNNNNNIKSNNNNNCRSLQQVSSPGFLVINPLLPQQNIVACVRAPTSCIMQRRKRSKASAETREESSRYYGLVR